MTTDDPSSAGRTPAENAELALLLEVAGTPKPGNVDRHRDLDGLRFEHFLAGAVGAGRGLRRAERGAAVGDAFEAAVAGMHHQSGGNTQFGCLLLIVPLVVAASQVDDPLTRADARAVVDATTVADAAGFYRAFEHVDVAVADPPTDTTDLDVRRGADAIPTLEARDVTFRDVMALSADRDANARELVTGFPRTFAAAETLLDGDDPVLDRAAAAFLRLLADEPDTLVAVQHGEETADTVRDTAADLVERDATRAEVEAFADDLASRGVNPGTTADLTAAALFVALERGLTV